jgi:PKD repeat protein
VGAARWAVSAVVTACLVVAGMLVAPLAASAAAGDVGVPGATFNGLSTSPTADKAESKLWFNDGRWWAVMLDQGTQDWHIFWLDRSTGTWMDTGVRADERATTSSDVLWDGSKLYIGTHSVRPASSASAAAEARLYRYTYVPAAKTYTLDSGFPTVIDNVSSEALTIDKDSSGRLWATWTKVDTTTTSTGATALVGQVYLNATTDADGTWGTPFVMPTTGGVNPATAGDDISALVAVRNKIGVLWSNQRDNTVYWSMHDSGNSDPTAWAGMIARRGPAEADDHLNLKTVQSDAAGRVFAVVKTGLDTRSNASPTDPQIRLLTFNSGSWSATTFGTLADCHTRPQLVLDETHQRVIVVATGPTGSGQCTPSRVGSIYMKSTSMDAPSFSPGVGTVIMRDAAADSLNDATTSKQSVTSATGLVVLASNLATHRYWHADIELGAATTVPASSFTASPTSGKAPLTVQFTDTSTGAPTTWKWNFGDGTTSTEQNPQHTFATAGQFVVRMTASNTVGTGSEASQTITVTSPSFPRDLSGDGRADLLAADSKGALWLYRSAAGGGFGSRSAAGSGWQARDLITMAGDFDGQPGHDVVARDPRNGDLWLYSGNSAGGFGSWRVIGRGWQVMNALLSPGDWNGDGHADLIARRASDGALLLYPGNGNGGFLASSQIGSGWGVMTALAATGDWNRNGMVDFVARRNDGALFLYEGNGRGGFAPTRQIGKGWQVFTAVVGMGDWDGDGSADLLARRSDGGLLLYPGTGDGGFKAARQIGAGWGGYRIAG